MFFSFLTDGYQNVAEDFVSLVDVCADAAGSQPEAQGPERGL